MTHYEFLQIGHAALPETIRNAGEKKRRELTAQGATPAELASLDTALRVLLDPDARRRYDATAEGVATAPSGELPPPPMRPAPGEAPAYGLAEANAEPVATAASIQLDVEYPESLSRALLLFKFLLVIPAYIVLGFYGIAVFVVSVFALLFILVTGRYPASAFDFARGYLQLQARTYFYFPLLATDEYPLEDTGSVVLHIDEPASLSRWLALLKAALWFAGWIFWTIVVIQVILVVIAIPMWFVVLILGRYPRRVFRLTVTLSEWAARLSTWQWFLRDEVPWIRASRTALAAIAVIALVPTLLIWVGSVGGAGDGGEWREYELDDGRYAIKFPGRPIEETQTVNTLLGRIDVRTATFTHLDGAFFSFVTEVLGPSPTSTDQRNIVDNASEAFADILGGEILNDRRETVAGFNARAMAIDLPGDGNTAWYRAFFADGDVYELLVFSDTDLAFIEADRFFVSFKLRSPVP